ncbi:MAG: hypothetical protein BTN85_0968 [Candidatus Methanohalarchaeum thermophilum]|uniref:DUF2124 domain-containing protein n=1 Tax=Methanohalarchaeum thermophilum TaxID=1903181 RepID=A0A1Q6DVV9_METT1|nr:MAG: hypothetical protein BTN85_0968 [Candidatus Methanohalarchaeum thermophilum]
MIKKIDEGSGISFLLRKFASLAADKNLEKIVFSGSSFTCIPFAELAAYSSRKTSKSYFIPNTEIAKAKKLVEGEIGIEVSELEEKKELSNPSALVLLGGLAMPQTKTGIEDVKELIDKLSPSCLIGMCFMGIFFDEDWVETLDFKYLLDTTFNPVKLYKK